MKYFIKQLGEKDCAFTCLKMLLSIAHKNRNYLYLEEQDINCALSLSDVVVKAKEHGVELDSYRLANKNDIFKLTKFPVLIPLYNNGISHLVLVKNKSKDSLQFYDPAIGVYWIKFEDFEVNWGGIVLEIVKVERTRFKRHKTRIIPKKLLSFTAFFQILGFILLFTALFFINKESNFLIPVLLFLSAFICQFAYNHFLILQMKFFDENMINRMNFSDINSTKERYQDLSNFKVALIGSPVQLVNSICILVAGFVILSINNYLNLLNLVMVLTFVVGLFILERTFFVNVSDKVEILESKVFVLQDDEIKIKDNLKKLQKKTYMHASFKVAKKYIILFLSIVICLIYSSLLNQISINFVMFHVYLYYQLGQTFSNVLDMLNEGEKIRWWRCFYEYLIKSDNHEIKNDQFVV